SPACRTSTVSAARSRCVIALLPPKVERNVGHTEVSQHGVEEAPPKRIPRSRSRSDLPCSLDGDVTAGEVALRKGMHVHRKGLLTLPLPGALEPLRRPEHRYWMMLAALDYQFDVVSFTLWIGLDGESSVRFGEQPLARLKRLGHCLHQTRDLRLG